MSEKIKDYLGVVGVIFLVFLMGATITCLSIYRDSIPKNSLRSFTVSEEGKVVAIPDVAMFSFNVTTQGGMDVSSLQEENTEKMNKAIEFLKDNDVEDKDIKTLSYNIEPRYEYVNNGQFISYPRTDREIVGYTVTQTVSVKARDFSKTGELLSGVVNNGANSVSSLSFDIDDKEAYEQEARAKAILAAKEKAKIIAGTGKFKIGRLISVQEYSSVPYFGGDRSFEAALSSKAPAPVIEAGSQDVTVNVTLTYEIK